MLTRTQAIRDTDKSHVHLAVESVIGLSFITEVVALVSLS